MDFKLILKSDRIIDSFFRGIYNKGINTIIFFKTINENYSQIK